VRFRFQITRKGIQAFESEHKDALEIPHCFHGSVDRHGATRVRETPQIIEPHDVVGVRVRENYGIHPPNILTQRLRPKIRTGVDDERTFRRLDVDGRAQPLIPWIGR
jgi:hypothetical protein